MTETTPGMARRALGAAGLWALTRLLMAALWATRESFIENDVRYYHRQLVNNGLHEALVEYPTPIPVALEIVRAVLSSGENSFLLVFAVGMALLDGLTTCWLWLRVDPRAAVYWTLFIASIGSLVWFRIDLIPAVAVVMGLGWLNRRPRAAGAAIAVGAATKLWPALLIGPMIGAGRRSHNRGLGFLVTGGALGLGSLLVFGLDRSISPLTWQSDRGLQIESIPATVPMLRHAFGQPTAYHTELSQYNAFEIYGPGVGGWLRFGDALMVCAIGFALALAWLIAANGIGLPGRRLHQSTDPAIASTRVHAIVLATTAILCAMIVANKTFSPQYMIWLAGPLAVLISLPLTGRDATWARWLAGLGLVCAVATHLVYPLHYGGLIAEQAAVPETLLLAARNLAVMALTVLVGYRAVIVGMRLGAMESEQTGN